MAVEAGWQGQVRVGAQIVASMRGWELVTDIEAVETGELGTQAETYIGGRETGSGSFTAQMNDDDAGQAALTGIVTLELDPAGTGSGKPRRAFSALVSQTAERATRTGAVERDYSFMVSGAIDRTPQA